MDFALVDVTFFIISMALFLIILDGHICSVLLDGAAARVVGYVNVALHIGMFVSLAFSRVALEFLVLMFMASVFCYCLAFYVRYRVELKREARVGTFDASPDSTAPAVGIDQAPVGETVTETDSLECDGTASEDSGISDMEPVRDGLESDGDAEPLTDEGREEGRSDAL